MFCRIHVNIDTKNKTVYGNRQGGRKGHNRKHRCNQGQRPLLGFNEKTREYLIGKLRQGTTVDGTEAAAFFADIKKHLPGCIQEVLLRVDGVFLSWQSVQTALEAGFDFIITNKGCPRFLTMPSGIGSSNTNGSNTQLIDCEIFGQIWLMCLYDSAYILSRILRLAFSFINEGFFRCARNSRYFRA
jgi:hypothetical protein